MGIEQNVPRPGRRFDVAIWRAWPSFGFPVVDVVEAPDAIAAIVQVMRARRWTWAARVAAHDLDGSLRHRAYGVRLAPVVVKKAKRRRKEGVRQLPLIDNLGVMDQNGV